MRKVIRPIVISDHEFEVIGEGAVTIMDASRMDHSNLPYCRENEPPGIFDIVVRVLPHGSRYNLKTCEPISPPLKKMTGENSRQ